MLARANKQRHSLHVEGGAVMQNRTISVARLLAFWLVLAVAMSTNGIFRELALVPFVGRAKAGVLSAGLGAAIILAVTRVAYRPQPNRASANLRQINPLGVSCAWLAMTVAFEELFGHYVDGKSWAELAANYALWRGQLWPLVLLTLGITPFLWGRWWIPRGR